MVQHRMIGRKIEFADHPHRFVPGLDAGELDTFVGMEQLAAGQILEKIEVPP